MTRNYHEGSFGKPEEEISGEETAVAPDSAREDGQGEWGTPEKLPHESGGAKGFRFTVAKKLIFGFGLLTLLFVVCGAVVLGQISLIRHNLGDLKQIERPLLAEAENMDTSIYKLSYGLLGYLYDYKDPIYSQRYHEAVDEFSSAVEHYKKLTASMDTDRQKKMGEKIEGLYGRLKEMSGALYESHANLSKRMESYVQHSDQVRELMTREILRPEDPEYLLKFNGNLKAQLAKNRVEKYMSLFLEVHENSLEEGFRIRLESLRKDIQEFQNLRWSAQERTWADRCASELASLIPEAEGIVEDAKKSNKALEGYLVLRRQVGEVIDKEITTDAEAEMNQSVELVEDSVKSTAIVTIVILFLAVLVSLTAAVLISRSIVKPLRLVMGNMDAIGREGDLTKDATIQSSDEIGVLSKVLNLMRKNLGMIVMRIHQASIKINSTSNQILAASTEHESTSNEQAAQMEEIQATLNQAAATVTELDRNTKEILKFSQEIGRQSEEGTQFIVDTNTKIGAMNESNKNVADKLRILNEKIEGIGKILTTILSVADQTNLLSLNAAIEAAKAGEHGKGFSVVAQEIRRLADQTAQSSQEISKIVGEVQAASSSAIMGMDKSAQDVAESTRVVGDLSQRFNGISTSVQSILPQLESITQGMSEFSAGNKETLAAVGEMSKALKMTADAAKQLRQAAYDLTSMGQQLRGAVGQFKLK
jgi:methyl-accepting chemotaxis protein